MGGTCILRNLWTEQHDVEITPLVLLPAARQVQRPFLLQRLLLLLL